MKGQSFFMVFLENGNNPTCRHSTLDGAENEAKRLTELTGNKSWVLCSIKSISVPQKYTIEDCRPNSDDLPF